MFDPDEVFIRSWARSAFFSSFESAWLASSPMLHLVPGPIVWFLELMPAASSSILHRGAPVPLLTLPVSVPGP